MVRIMDVNSRDWEIPVQVWEFPGLVGLATVSIGHHDIERGFVDFAIL